jgi:hypothetical protein
MRALLTCVLLLAMPASSGPGERPAPPAAGELVITEIHADPDPTLGDASGDGVRHAVADEFVELVNVSGHPLDLAGVTLADAVRPRHVFPPGGVLAPGRAVVVFGGTASTGALALNNRGDTVTVRGRDGGVVDTYTYGGEGGMDQSIVANPEPVLGTCGGRPLVPHLTVNPFALFSPGTQADGSTTHW